MGLIRYLGTKEELENLNNARPNDLILAFEKGKTAKLPLIALCSQKGFAYDPNSDEMIAKPDEYAFLNKHKGDNNLIIGLDYRYEIPNIKEFFSQLKIPHLKITPENCPWQQNPVIYAPDRIIVGKKAVIKCLGKWVKR